MRAALIDLKGEFRLFVVRLHDSTVVSVLPKADGVWRSREDDQQGS